MKINSISMCFVVLVRCLFGKDIYGEDLKQEVLSNAKKKEYDTSLIYSLFFTRNQITIFEKRLFQITTWLFVLEFLFFFINTLIHPVVLFMLFLCLFLWYPFCLFPFALRIPRLIFIFAVWISAFWFGVFSFYLSIIPSIFGFGEIIFDRRMLMGSKLFYQFFDLSFDKLWIVFIVLMIPLAILTLVSYRRILFVPIFILILTASFWYFLEFADKIYQSGLYASVKLDDIKSYQKKIKRFEDTAFKRKTFAVTVKPTEIYYYDKLYNKENKCVRDFFVNETIGRGYKNDYTPSIGMLYCDFVSKMSQNPDKIDVPKSKTVNSRKRIAEEIIQRRSAGKFCTSYYDHIVKKAREECNK